MVRKKVMSEQEYLNRKGVGSSLSGVMDDRLRSVRQLRSTRGNETNLNVSIKDQYLVERYDHQAMLKRHGRLHTAYLKTELYKQQDACQLSMAQIGKLVKEQEQLLVEDYGLLFIKVLQAVEEVNYV